MIGETFLWTTSRQAQYSVWQAVGCHSNDMADPAQLPLQNHLLQGIIVTGLCSMADLYMCHFVPPAEAENPLQTANVEGFKGFNVVTVQDPGFTSIQQYSDTDSIVNCNFGRC